MYLFFSSQHTHNHTHTRRAHSFPPMYQTLGGYNAQSNVGPVVYAGIQPTGFYSVLVTGISVGSSRLGKRERKRGCGYKVPSVVLSA